jgi:hypothetical protein
MRQVKANIKNNHELAAMRDWLLPRLMTGQVVITQGKNIKGGS